MIWTFYVALVVGLSPLTSTQKLCWTLDSECLRRIDEFVTAVMKCRHVPGVSLTIVKDFRTMEGVSRGYGFADVGKQSPVTNTTKFPIGALTKAFTSTLVAVMLSKHKDRYLNQWDTTVKEILGDDFRLYDEWRTERSTLRDLAAHKLGLHTYYLPLLAGLDTSHAPQEYCRRLKHLIPAADFRTRFILNDYSYILLGCVIEKIGQGSYDQLLTSSILDRLDMTSTSIAYTDEALSYVRTKGQFVALDSQLSRPSGATVAALGLVSNGVDMLKWMQFHIRGKGEQLGIDEKLLEETHRAQIVVTDQDLPTTAEKPLFPFSDKVHSYNLGWLSGIYRGYSYMEHGGLMAGFGAHLRLFHQGKVGIYVNVNGPQYRDAALARYTIIWYLSDLLLGQEPVINSTTVCSFMPSVTGTQSPGPAVEFTELYKMPPGPSTASSSQRFDSCDIVHGKYGHPLFGNVTVLFNPDSSSLNMQIGTLGILNLQSNVCGSNYTGVFLSPIDALFEQRKQRNEVQIHFSNSEPDGSYSKVTLGLPDLNSEALVTYTRGLQWDETVATNSPPQTSQQSCNLVADFVPNWALFVLLQLFIML